MRATGTCVSENKKRTVGGNAAAVESVEALAARGVVALTISQMAAALQVTYRTITAMIRRKEISHFKIGKRLVRIPLAEARRLMASQAEVAR